MARLQRQISGDEDLFLGRQGDCQRFDFFLKLIDLFNMSAELVLNQLRARMLQLLQLFNFLLMHYLKVAMLVAKQH